MLSRSCLSAANGVARRAGARNNKWFQWIATPTALLVILVVGCASTNPQVSMLIEYTRSGGIQGLDDHLVISTDGRATLTRRTAQSQFTVDPDTITQLRTVLEATAFRTLDDEYLPERPGADLFEYTIRHDGHTIRTKDFAVPDVIQPLIQLLNSIIDSA